MNHAVCITGGGSGLGLAFARHYAALGYELLLIDKNSETLDKACEELKSEFGVEATGYCVDLCNREQLESLCESIGYGKPISVLVNNAGFGLPGRFVEAKSELIGAMVDLHVQASVKLCRAVLPGMIERSSGAIINVASLGGFRPGPGDIVYGATKRFLIHFSKSLQQEVAPAGVKVQALCPGFVHTEFHDGPTYKKSGAPSIPAFFWMSAEQVVSGAVAALSGKKVVCVPGVRGYLLVFMAYNPLLWRIVCALNRRLR